MPLSIVSKISYIIYINVKIFSLNYKLIKNSFISFRFNLYFFIWTAMFLSWILPISYDLIRNSLCSFQGCETLHRGVVDSFAKDHLSFMAACLDCFSSFICLCTLNFLLAVNACGYRHYHQEKCLFLFILLTGCFYRSA